MQQAVPKVLLFILAPNNSGSTLLRKHIEQSFFARFLEQEAQHTKGFIGPSSRETGLRLLWAHTEEAVRQFSCPSAYDWQASAKAWFKQSKSNSVKGIVFVTSSPPFLLLMRQLDQHFSDARFLIMARDPYAVVEGIYRRRKLLPVSEENCYQAAAEHIVRCLHYQRRNIDAQLANSVTFTYEDLCDHTNSVKQKIQELVPELIDLNFVRKVSVKGQPASHIENRNTQQISALKPEAFENINNVFGEHQALLESFGYAVRHG